MTCPTCKSIFDKPVDNCPKCGFPFNGSESQKSSFIAQQIIKVGHIDDARKSVKSAKATLFIIGGINIVLAIFSSAPGVLEVGVFIGAGFIAFGLLVDRNPFLFLVIPLSLLLLFYLGDAIYDPMTIVRGLAFKIGYVTALVYGIVRVNRAQKIMKESEYLSKK